MRNTPSCDRCLFYAVCKQNRFAVCADYYDPAEDDLLVDEYIESERMIFRSLWNQYAADTYEE